jgi:DNA-binding response OmpR family regulator
MADGARHAAGGRVLIAAADAVFAADLQRELRRQGLESRIFQTADEALAALGEGHEGLGLLVLDSSLTPPELFRVYQQLRSEDAATAAPVVFSRSAFGPAQGAAEGPDHYLASTATARDVAERARELLPDRRPPAGQVEARPTPAAEVGPLDTEPSPGRTRTAVLGVLLGIVIGLVILALIWMDGLPVTLPRITPLLGG